MTQQNEIALHDTSDLVALKQELAVFKGRLEELENSTLSARIGAAMKKVSATGLATGRKIRDAGRATGRKIRDAGRATGHKISNAGRATGRKVSHVGRATGRKVSEACHFMACQVEAVGNNISAESRRFAEPIMAGVRATMRTVGARLIQMAGDNGNLIANQ